MKLFGLIGYPLTHSFSQKYFTEKFLRERIANCAYQNFPLKDIAEFPQLFISHPDLYGLNVTIPYKQNVISFLDELTDTAKQIGAVNCIQLQSGKKIGYNTDVIGFENSLLPMLHHFNSKALLLGTGGAAKAVAYCLQKLHIPFLQVSRSSKHGCITYQEINKKIMQEHLLIINATPAGMAPDINTAPPIPFEFITAHHILYDLVYNPEKTLFLRKGEEQNATIKNGHEMLLLQAEAAWKIWNEE